MDIKQILDRMNAFLPPEPTVRLSVEKGKPGLDILWGDMGTGTFLIPRERLKALDFPRVLYNYDCS